MNTCKECGCHQSVINRQGETVCQGCGLVIDEDSKITNFGKRLYEKEDYENVNHASPTALDSGDHAFGTTFNKIDKFKRLHTINENIRKSILTSQKKDFIYFLNVKDICNQLKLSNNTKNLAVDILRRVKYQDQEFFYKKDRVLLASAAVFQASRLYDSNLTQKDLTNLQDLESNKSIKLKNFGIDSQKEVILTEEEYVKLMHSKNTSESNLNISFNSIKKSRTHLLNQYIFYLSKYTIDIDYETFMKIYVEKIKFKNGKKIDHKYHASIVDIANKIFKKARFYKSPPTTKALCSLYIAVMLKFDRRPSKFHTSILNGVLNRMCELLNIKILTKTDKSLIRTKYRLYPNNFKRSYFIIKKDPMRKILKDDLPNITDAPFGFETEFGNHYVYIPKKNPYVLMKIYDEVFRVGMEKFIAIVNKIVENNEFTNCDEEAVYNFLIEGDIINVTPSEFQLKHSRIRSNSIINMLLNIGKGDKITYFSRKKKKCSNILVRGTVEIESETKITIKTNRFKNPIVSITKPNRNNVVRTESYDLIALERLLKEIENRNFNISEIVSIPHRLVTPTIKLLELLKIVEKDNVKGYKCSFSFGNMMNEINQSFFSTIFQTASAK